MLLTEKNNFEENAILRTLSAKLQQFNIED